MDLEGIKKNYSKAWSKFKEWYYAQPHLPVHPDGFKAYPHEFQVGCLLKFLDDHEVYAHVQPLSEDHYNGAVFVKEVVRKAETIGGHKTRKEAEVTLITKAFKILEQRL